MKSSFSWPGRPPAEMISRNVKRLLTSILDGRLKRGAFGTSTLDGTLKRGTFYTSILDGTLKRGAFCTSTLDGTLKRGAFCTSTLDGTPKRGAFCTSTLDGRLKRDAFLCTRVGTYCIRPTKRSRKGTRSAKGGQTHDSLSPTGPFSGAYAIRPYHATSKRDAFLTSYLVATLKRGAFCTSYLVATPKRGAFCTSYLVATLKRGAFSCTRVGAYCIRPTKRSRKGTGSAKGDQTCDFLSPTGPFGGAYAIRPYHATSKRDAFCTSYLVATPKRAAFCTSYLVATLKRGAFCTSTLDGTPKRDAFCTSTLDGTPKRGAFCTSYLVGTPKRGTFCTSYLVGTLKRGAFCTSYLVGSLRRSVFCLFYSSFLALMQEKKQKKIKASGTPAKFRDFLMALMYPANFPALGRGPFLALMQEKKQKKIKASGMPANFCRVHHWRGRDLCHVPGKLPCLGRGCRPSLPPLFRLLFLAHSFSYVSVPYFPPEGVHPDVP